MFKYNQTKGEKGMKKRNAKLKMISLLLASTMTVNSCTGVLYAAEGIIPADSEVIMQGEDAFVVEDGDMSTSFNEEVIFEDLEQTAGDGQNNVVTDSTVTEEENPVVESEPETGSSGDSETTESSDEIEMTEDSGVVEVLDWESDGFVEGISLMSDDFLVDEFDIDTLAEAEKTHNVFQNTQSTLAPGVTQNVKYAYAADGKQMVYYIATADVTRDDVVVQSSYYKQHEGGVMGMAKLTEQIAYANQKYTNSEDPLYISDYYNVVAGVNSSFYNMTTGQPMGITFIDGVSFGTNSYDNFFAILKDGKTAVIDYAKNLGNYVDENGESTIWQAAAGSQWLVRDGKDVTADITGAYNTDRHSRTCVGVTADGKVVLMVLDGRQEPFSCGGSMHELAQIMLEAGCVTAVNLDGGGSTTFASKAEGANSVKVINRPSDGSERAISAGIIIASTTAPSDVFDHVNMTVENEYVAPGVSTKVTVIGVSPAGTTAEIPEDVTYTAVYGTIEDGVYTAGTVETKDTILAKIGDQIVGSAEVNIIVPDAIRFDQAEVTVPFGKSVTIGVTATTNDGMNVVGINEDTVDFNFDANVGTMNGFEFTANPEGETATQATCTVTVKEAPSVTATTKFVLGKGSGTIIDFEVGNETSDTLKRQDIINYNYRFPNNTTSIVTRENGKVHSGDTALGVTVDFTNSFESGYMATAIGARETITIENGLALGFWIYVPKEAEGMRIRMCFYDKDDARQTQELLPIGKISTLNVPGWTYVSADISKYPVAKILKDKSWLEFYLNDRDNEEDYDYKHTNYDSLNTKVTFYIDDITVDYSSVIEDREAPVFADVTYAYQGAADAANLTNNSVIPYSDLEFAVSVSETERNNASGINASTAKAYIDGNEVDAKYGNGKIVINKSISLADGKHIVKFEIADNVGNTSFVSRTFTVNGQSGKATVKLVPHDSTLNNIPFGSIYYVDLVATDIEKISSVTTELDLNNMNTWQLEHMEIADGFEATYRLDEITNTVALTLTRKRNRSVTGEGILVSIPIRAYELSISPIEEKDAAKPAGTVLTYASFKKAEAAGECWPVSVNVEIEKGLVTFTNNNTAYFSGNVKVMTEARWWHNAATKEDEAGYLAWNGGHDHRAETKQYYGENSTNHVDAVAKEDKAATCTEAGYTGRTYCETCKSVVDWGEKIPATGHDFDFVDGVYKCTNSNCNETFTGKHTDGKEYVDGVATVGWYNNSYYVDGEKLTGIQLVAAPEETEEYYYDFGEDGESKGKYTGLFYDGEVYRYAQIGKLSGGWKIINNEWYYFRESTMAAPEKGYVYWSGIPYQFEETGKLVSGVWVTSELGDRYYYASSHYYSAAKTSNVTFVTINGKTYGFDRNGYIYKNGVYGLYESNQKELVYYSFDADGVCTKKVSLNDYVGIIKTTSGGLYYYKNGKPTQVGLVKIDSNYYYVRSGGVVAVGDYYCTYNMTTEVPVGTYHFDKEGRMTNVPNEPSDNRKNGIVNENGTLFYYVDDEKQFNLGLIEIEDNGEKCYIYVRTAGQLAVGKYKVWINNDIVPYASEQIFGSDGKMQNSPIIDSKNGIINENGILYYYVNGEKQLNLGLIEIEDNGKKCYIYVRTAGQLAVGRYKVWINNDIVPYASEQTFGSDGKMINPPVKEDKNGIVNENGTLYYYVNGEKQLNLGLIEIEDKGEKRYIYVRTSGQLAVGEYKVWINNGIVPYASLQTFDTQTGYMISK